MMAVGQELRRDGQVWYENLHMKLIIFLSTGRCGTQFFMRYLAGSASDRAVVTHEPVEADYAPKYSLRAPDLEELLSKYPSVRAHFDEIARIGDGGQVYIETGWPSFSWVPLLLHRFGDEAMVVHVTRNPVRFAFSFASHRFFGTMRPRRRDAYVHLAQLHPADPGVKHRQYETQWDSLNPVEKSLFQWLEVNAWAEELKAAHPESFVTLRAEDALAQPELLLESILERRPQLADVFRERPTPPGVVDEYRRTIRFQVESVRYLPEVQALADQYGYSMDVDGIGIVRRFLVENGG
jgi:hypothetical protein